jgi:hypothetical protein
MRSFTVACLAALLSTVAPAAAQTATGGPAPSPAPVTISTCSGGLSSCELVEIATYDVTFRNTASVAADRIRLSALYGRRGKRATFEITGLFPPGADVSRHLRHTVSGGLYSFRSDKNDCVIDFVHFTDGSSWSPPRPQS